METVRELADLERERDKEVNKLKRRICQPISLHNYNELENIYSRVKRLHSAFYAKVEDCTELLKEDDNGDPIYPERGMPESRYVPDNEDLKRKTTILEEILDHTADALIEFMVSLPAPLQVLLAEEASLPFLKNLDVIKNHIAAKATGANEEQEEEDDTDTVINGEDTGNNNEVPIDNDLTGDQSGVPVLNAGGHNVLPTPPPSPIKELSSTKGEDQ